MKKTIKILSLILAFVIALVPFCASAYKVDGFTLEIKDWIQNDGIWFYDPNPIDNTAAICGYMGKDKDVVIPEIVGDKYKVTELKLNTPDMFENDAGGLPVLTSAANIETLTLPKTLKLISNEFSSHFYGTNASDKDFVSLMEGELKCNGKVIMKGYFASEPLYNLKAFIVDEENQYFSSKDGVLYDKDQNVLIQYPWGKTEKKFEIPNTVKQIMPFAIDGYASIEEIVINENVEKLGTSCIGDASYYVKMGDRTSPEHYMPYSDASKRGKITILNNVLDEDELSHLFCHDVYDAGYKYKLTVYKNSPADKFFSSTHSEITVTEVVKRLANPYIKDEPKKEDEENTSSKNTTSKKENIKDNSSKTESVVSKPTESVITEPLESEEDLTIGATENNADNVNEEKPKKTNKIWVIVVVAAVVLLAGGAVYWIVRKKKKV
jgi:hypothetical protein